MKFKDIPANRNLPAEGFTDPAPHLGPSGSWRRRLVSAMKGIFTSPPNNKDKDDDRPQSSLKQDSDGRIP